jgi:uncharacterized protein
VCSQESTAETSVARQRLAETRFRCNEYAVINQRSARRLSQTRVEAVSNTSTVALRVVEGDEKGSLESETVKYGCEFYVTRTRE